MSPSRLMDWAFLANTTGTPKWRATTHAMPMPEASMVRIFVMGASANSRLNSTPMASNRSMSSWWFRKLSTLRTPSDFTTPSRLMRSSKSSTCRLRRVAAAVSRRAPRREKLLGSSVAETRRDEQSKQMSRSAAPGEGARRKEGRAEARTGEGARRGWRAEARTGAVRSPHSTRPRRTGSRRARCATCAGGYSPLVAAACAPAMRPMTE